MAKAIIHIGMHKTGSSSIQATLAGLPPGRGPTIVQIGGSPNLSGQLKKGFNSNLTAARVRSFTSETFNEKRALHKEKIKRGIASYAGRDIIISAEGFTGLASSDFTEFMALLPGYDIHVIGYVRSPRSMMSSAFQQRLKSGLARLNPNALIPAYRKILEKFEQAPSFTLRLFDRRNLLNGDVVQDFCQFAGVSISPDEVVTKNEGLSLEAGKLLFHFSKWREKVGLIRQRGFILTETLAELEGEKLHLSSEIIDPVLAAHQDSIGWVERKLGVSFDHDRVEGGIKSEDDMLNVSEKTTRWLAAEVRKDWKGPPSPDEIGVWMQMLYERTPLITVRKLRKELGMSEDEEEADGDS